MVRVAICSAMFHMYSLLIFGLNSNPLVVVSALFSEDTPLVSLVS